MDALDYLILIAAHWRRVVVGAGAAVLVACAAVGVQRVEYAGARVLRVEPVEAGETLAAALEFRAVAGVTVRVTADRRFGLVQLRARGEAAAVERALDRATAWLAGDIVTRHHAWRALDPLVRATRAEPSAVVAATTPPTPVGRSWTVALLGATLGGALSVIALTLIEAAIRTALIQRPWPTRRAQLAERIGR